MGYFRHCALILASVFLLTVDLTAQPVWLDAAQRELKYPAEDYLIGFSSLYLQPGDEPNEKVRECRRFARIDLTESLALTVNIQTTLSLSQTDEKYTESFDVNSVTSSALEAVGMKTEDYLDVDQQVVYSFAYLNRRSLVKAYYKKLSRTVTEVKAIVERDDHPSNELAYESYMQGLYLLNQSSSYTHMLMNLDISNEAVLMMKQQSAYLVILREKVNGLKKAAGSDLDLGIRLMIDQLVQSLGQDEELFISPLTFKNKGITTEFSSYFDQSFRRHVLAKVKVTSKPVEKRVSGNYWLNDDQLQVTVNIHKYDGDDPYQLLSGESMTIDRALLDSLQIKYDFTEEDSSLDLMKMAENRVNGGMFAKVTTNKGNDGLYFTEGEVLKLYVQVSRPSYVRLVNVWSDGNQLSLLENYYVEPSQVNQPIELPFEWETQCPCGLELIKLYTQSHAFPPVELTSEDGFDFISGSLSSTVEKSRSTTVDIPDNEAFYFGEASLLVTTLERK